MLYTYDALQSSAAGCTVDSTDMCSYTLFRFLTEKFNVALEDVGKVAKEKELLNMFQRFRDEFFEPQIVTMAKCDEDIKKVSHDLFVSRRDELPNSVSRLYEDILRYTMTTQSLGVSICI